MIRNIHLPLFGPVKWAECDGSLPRVWCPDDNLKTFLKLIRFQRTFFLKHVHMDKNNIELMETDVFKLNWTKYVEYNNNNDSHML